jgi:hypothetical protein
MFVPIILAAVGAAVSAYGAIQQGKAQSENAKAQASASRYNSAIEQQNESLAGSMASSHEQQQRMSDMQTLGSQRAALAEGGQLGTPGAQQITRQSAINAEMNALNTRYSGVLQSRNAANAAAQYSYKADVYDVNARMATQAGEMGAATSLMKGAQSIYGYGAGMGSWGQS